MDLLTKQKQTPRLTEWNYVCQGEGWGDGIVREFGMDMYTLLYLKWITNKALLYNTWNSTQCNVAAWMGGTFGGELDTCISNWIHVYPLEKAMAPHSSTLAWKIPWTEEPGGLQSVGLLRVGHDWATSLSLFTFMHWRRNWQPTPVFLPGESQGQRSLVGRRLWGRTELDMKDFYSLEGKLWPT